MARTKPSALSSPLLSPAPSLSDVAQAWQQGQLAKAEKLVKEVLSAEPESAHAWFIYSQIALACNQARKALEALEHLKDAVELSLSVACLRGRCHLALGAPNDALAALTVALEYKADDPLAHHLMGLAHNMKGNKAQAMRLFQRATFLAPEMGPAHYELAVLALQEQDGPSALQHCTRATECMPESPQAWNNLGLAWRANGHNSEAVSAARRAVSLLPTYAEGWYNLSQALANLGQQAEANQARDKAFALAPGLKDLVASPGTDGPAGA